MSNPLVVNLFGVPDAGKSTGAAYIFSRLKMEGINVELVTEFAKDKVWEHNEKVFESDNQCYIFGQQFYRMSRCRDNVDVIVTDSPLLLNALFNSSETLGDNFNKVVFDCFNTFNNISYMLIRTTPYNPVGRIHSEEESAALEVPLVELLNKRNVEFKYVSSNIGGYDTIVTEVLETLKGDNYANN